MSAPSIDRAALPPDPRDNWAALDAAERDAAYNNNAAAADSAMWIEKRNRDSAAYRAAHAKYLDLAYAPLVHDAWRFTSCVAAPARPANSADRRRWSLLRSA